MEKEADLLDLLKQAMRTCRTDAPRYPQIVFNGPIIVGTDIGSITALRIILQAQSRSQEPDLSTVSRAKPA